MSGATSTSFTIKPSINPDIRTLTSMASLNRAPVRSTFTNSAPRSSFVFSNFITRTIGGRSGLVRGRHEVEVARLHAPVDEELRARAVGAFVGCEEEHEVADVLGRADAA